MPRVISLIASATEIVCTLGCEDELVGRSHECDYPESVRRLPQCTAPAFDVAGAGVDIDRRVRDRLREGLSIYHVDSALLKELQPDVVVTQSQCEVCAVSEEDVAQALAEWVGGRPRVVSLQPNSLADVWDDIETVAKALDVPEVGTRVVKELKARVADIAARARSLTRPRVACIEWVDPLMAAGNWVPELVELAGGMNLFGSAGMHAPGMTFDQLCAQKPDVIVAMPCGFDLERTRLEMPALAERPGWNDIPAVRQNRVYVTDGNQFFNRPGPRLVESLEILAEIFHPEAFAFGHVDRNEWQPYPCR
jgi:iron complex transport system substrate-binding protein